jgi:hypothetical protein
MLYGVGARPSPPIERSFRSALERGGAELLSVVDQLLGPRLPLRIGDTTKTAYRRVHEVLASVLDFAARAAADESQWKTVYNKLVVELSRARIIVNYQLAREQISQDIATLLNDVLNAIDSAVRNNQREVVQELAERGRVLIDALAVLVYRFGKER